MTTWWYLAKLRLSGLKVSPTTYALFMDNIGLYKTTMFSRAARFGIREAKVEDIINTGDEQVRPIAVTRHFQHLPTFPFLLGR